MRVMYRSDGLPRPRGTRAFRGLQQVRPGGVGDGAAHEQVAGRTGKRQRAAHLGDAERGHAQQHGTAIVVGAAAAAVSAG